MFNIHVCLTKWSILCSNLPNLYSAMYVRLDGDDLLTNISSIALKNKQKLAINCEENCLLLITNSELFSCLSIILASQGGVIPKNCILLGLTTVLSLNRSLLLISQLTGCKQFQKSFLLKMFKIVLLQASFIYL